MPSIHEQYRELLALTQLHLLQEHSLKDKVPISAETYRLLKSAAKPAQPLAPPREEPSKSFQQALPQTPPPIPLKKSDAPGVKPLPLPKPLEEAAAPAESRAPKEERVFVPENQQKNAAVDFEDFKQILREKFPHVPIMDNPPAPASKLGLQAVILTQGESGSELQFLQNVCKAIQGLGVESKILPCAQIEKEQKWDKLLGLKDLKLLITSQAALEAYPLLGAAVSSNLKVFTYNDLKNQHIDPEFKQTLWKYAKNALATPSDQKS